MNRFSISVIQNTQSWFILPMMSPFIFATDDPGVECTNLTQEYVIFTMNHPDVTYNEIKEINWNIIKYSFCLKMRNLYSLSG